MVYLPPERYIERVSSPGKTAEITGPKLQTIYLDQEYGTYTVLTDSTPSLSDVVLSYGLSLQHRSLCGAYDRGSVSLSISDPLLSQVKRELHSSVRGITIHFCCDAGFLFRGQLLLEGCNAGA